MGTCTSCGHDLGVGRFCTSCGHPVGQEPHTARYPLFADEVAPDPVVLAPDPTLRGPRVWWPWVAVLVALVLVVALVIVALDWATGDGDRPSDGSSSPAVPAGRPNGGPGGDVAADASVTVPATAPPNQDTSGNRTTYDAANMLDGVPETCWRMPGDGTGSELTVSLPEETRLKRVGMINGYAKSAGDLDWYEGNRRVLSVEWVFDDGTTVEQDLTDTRELQTVGVDVTTTTVVVRLVAVSGPGTGPEARDYTAISELSLVRGR
jgi:hypothetical protein